MKEIKFEEKSHTYTDEEGKDLISVSKFTEKFKEKVDWNAIAKKVAAKLTKAGEPTTLKQVLDKWANKRDVSATIGTLYHSIREKELIEGTSEFYNVICNKKECIYKGKDKFSIPIDKLENNTVYPELMIYGDGICGQSDKVIIVNSRINIWDYKTDAEISFKGFSNDWTSARKLVDPLQHLDDCNGNLYSIKMSMYMYLLWKANKGRFLPGDIIIEHVHLKRDPDNDNIPVLDKDGKPVVQKIEQIKLPYRRKEVEAMLKKLNEK